MSDERKYRVILSGGVLPEKAREEVVDALAVLFNSRRGAMRELLSGKPVPLTKEYEREQAEKIVRAIERAGAECKLEEIGSPQPENEAEGEAEAEASAETETENKVAEDAAAFAADAPGDEPADKPADAGETTAETTAKAAYIRPVDTGEEAAAKEAALVRFIGPNAKYYLRQFAKFGGVENPTFALTWHWPAFLLFFFWAVHRRLWRAALVHLTGSLLLVMSFKPGLIYLGWVVFWPLVANYIYCRRVRDCVFGLSPKSWRTDFSPEADSALMKLRAGTSRAAVVLGVLLMLGLSALLNHPLSERMLPLPTLGGDSPARVLRQLGEGSPLEDGGAFNRRTVATTATLNMLSAAFKLAASDDTLADRQLTMASFREVIRRRDLKDAWGTLIAVKQDATGDVTLVSAGADRQFDSDDDIRHTVRFDES